MTEAPDPDGAGLILDQTGSYQLGGAFALVMGVSGFIAVLPLQHKPQSADFDNACWCGQFCEPLL